MLGTGTFFQDDEGVPDTSLLLLAAARLRDQAKDIAEEQQYIRGKPKLRPRTPPTRPRSTSPGGERRSNFIVHHCDVSTLYRPSTRVPSSPLPFC